MTFTPNIKKIRVGTQVEVYVEKNFHDTTFLNKFHHKTDYIEYIDGINIKLKGDNRLFPKTVISKVFNSEPQDDSLLDYNKYNLSEYHLNLNDLQHGDLIIFSKIEYKNNFSIHFCGKVKDIFEQDIIVECDFKCFEICEYDSIYAEDVKKEYNLYGKSELSISKNFIDRFYVPQNDTREIYVDEKYLKKIMFCYSHTHFVNRNTLQDVKKYFGMLKTDNNYFKIQVERFINYKEHFECIDLSSKVDKIEEPSKVKAIDTNGTIYIVKEYNTKKNIYYCYYANASQYFEENIRLNKVRYFYS